MPHIRNRTGKVKDFPPENVSDVKGTENVLRNNESYVGDCVNV